jgi:hypothetical protein
MGRSGSTVHDRTGDRTPDHRLRRYAVSNSEQSEATDRPSTDEPIVKTSDELDGPEAAHDASANEEDEEPGRPLEDANEGEDTVGEEVTRDLPGAAFQK